MIVLQVITDDDRRGAQVFALDLGEELAARGHSIRTVALAPGSTGGLDVEILGPTARATKTVLALRSLLESSDVVVAHGSSTLLATALAAAGRSTPWVYRQISDSLFWAGTPARRARVRAYLTRPDLVISLSPRMATVLTSDFGVASDRIRVVPNGVPASRFRPATPEERSDARRRYALDPDRVVVASVSALVPEKGVDLVIHAVADRSDVDLLVAGGGPDRDALRRLAAERLGPRARFVGSLEDLSAVYAAAEVIALPSRGGDVLPASLIEAGLCGLPSIVTDVGAITDIVVDGETGVVAAQAERAEVGAALAELLSDAAAREAMGRAARGRCLERFEIGPVADGWEAALGELVDAPR